MRCSIKSMFLKWGKKKGWDFMIKVDDRVMGVGVGR